MENQEEQENDSSSLLDRSISSDGTEFMDLPLAPIPEHCVEIQNLDMINARSSSPNEIILYARVNVFDDVSIDSLEEIRSSSSTEDKTYNGDSRDILSSGDESSSYREKSPIVNSQPCSPPYTRKKSNGKRYIEFCGL